MVPVIAMAASFSMYYPPPQARCVATSPVRPGQHVSYWGYAFEPAPGHAILFRIWVGRSPSFSSPGLHPVSYLVEDDRGLWGRATCDVRVLSGRSRGGHGGHRSGGGGRGSPPPAAQPPEVHVNTLPTLRRGERFEVHVRIEGPHRAPRINLPSSFYAAVHLPWGTADYARDNRHAPTEAAHTYTFALTVPWGHEGPPNGRYVCRVIVPWSGGEVDKTVRLRIQGDQAAAEPWLFVEKKNAAG